MFQSDNEDAYRAYRVIDNDDPGKRLRVCERFFVLRGQTGQAVGEQLRDELQARRLPSGDYVFYPEAAAIEITVESSASLTRVGDQAFTRTLGGRDKPISPGQAAALQRLEQVVAVKAAFPVRADTLDCLNEALAKRCVAPECGC